MFFGPLHCIAEEELTPAMMIYVGNLEYTVTSDELRALFDPFGTVTMAEVQVKSRTGQSRGFGLVEMTSESEAKAAINALHGTEFRDRALTVNESRPRRTVRDLYAGGGWFGGGGGGAG
jgi:RNA recognition motif-containing protein